ncbi:MAG: glycerophosphodiester phosphodiesterase family protein [Nocardioides sp.]
MRTGPLVVAHRGASTQAPENTLAAVHAAIAVGADAVEIDVRRTADGEFVVIHDQSLQRTTDVRRRHPRRGRFDVDTFSAADVAALDAGTWHGPEFAGTRVPTLGEVIAAVRPSGLGLVVEVKAPVGRCRGDLVDLAAVLDAGSLPHRRITVQSFDVGLVHDLRPLLPAVSLAVLVRHGRRDLADLSRWADQVSLHHRAVDRGTVDEIRGWGMRCMAWTVNRPGSMRRLVELGVDGIITDRPDLLRELRSAG